MLDDFDMDVGIKSTMAMVCCKSESGFGASNVSLREVEQVKSGLQHVHSLLLELYARLVK
jgi:hypothetical protein